MIARPLVYKRDGHWRISTGEHMDDLTEIPGYEGHYALTRSGRVFSLPRIVERKNGNRYTVTGGEVKPCSRSGYWVVRISKGGMRTWNVHILMALTFLGARPKGAQVRHLNGDPLNSHIDNLAYGTASENRFDSVKHGTHNEARKTECKYGHPFERHANGRRFCRICRRVWSARYKAKKRAER